MNRSPYLRTMALVLALTMASTGCAATASQPRLDRTLAACAEEDAETIRLARTGPSTLANVSHEEGDAEGLVQTRRFRGGGRAAGFFLFGVIVGFVVIADLLILPFTAPRRRAFTCTRTVYRGCCH